MPDNQNSELPEAEHVIPDEDAEKLVEKKRQSWLKGISSAIERAVTKAALGVAMGDGVYKRNVKAGAELADRLRKKYPEDFKQIDQDLQRRLHPLDSPHVKRLWNRK